MKRWLKKFLVVVLGLLVLMTILPMFISPRSVIPELISRLPYGWIGFLQRTLPEVTVNWSGIGMGLICSAIILYCLHTLGTWLTRPRETDGRPSWTWKRTGLAYGGLWLLFVLCMASSGIKQHLIWLNQAEEPIRVKRISHLADMKMIEGLVRTAMLEARPGRLVMSEWLRESDKHYSSMPPIWERYHVLELTKTNGMDQTFLVMPRDDNAQRRYGFLVIDTKNETRFPFEDLPLYLAPQTSH